MTNEPVDPGLPADDATEPVDTPAGPVDTPTEPVDTPEPPPAAFPPPPAGFPPPYGFPPPGGFPPPPPGTGGWATRYGLVRPAQGRMLAGVCAAVGRATNTDPVLWRVLFAVLTIAGGVGLLAYVLGWLLIPAEGDTASPVEALLGRGRSSTSPVLVVIVGVVAAISLGSVVYDGLRSAAILLAVILGAIILISRGGQPGGAPQSTDPSGPGTGTGEPPGTVPPVPPTWAAAPRTEWTGAPGWTAPAGWAGPPGGWSASGAPAGAGTAAAGAAAQGFRPPFAPHGPYASTSRYPYPGLAGTTPAGSPPPVAPVPPPVPARVRSRLGRFTLSLALLLVGVLAIVDVAGVRVPFSWYAGAVLAVLGLGLVIGAWFGRARYLIPLGLILTLVLLAGSEAHGRLGDAKAGDLSLVPQTVAEVDGEYRQGIGDFRLDLSHVDFAGVDKTVRITVSAGDLTIKLPPKVDTTVHAKVNAGDAQVFNAHWGGIGSAARTVVDPGTDGAGGGTLYLDIQLNLGDLAVSR
jgi:phage shock protein PspC (stress-responsive transcriptional regulator)